MLQTIIESLYFILPAYVANAFPVLLKKIPFGAAPINAPLFGKHKTWRGLYLGYFGALLVLFLQSQISTSYALINYAQVNIFLFALALGLGALLGDLIESFFKRRLKIKPGAMFFPFDQLDFIIGAVIATYPLFKLPVWHIVVLLLLTPVLHLITNIIAYKLKMKDVWW
ncbi:hypothetical protein COU74_01580 [Candidatus Peregrinibacteria bacterium CG10_big_fil_rev_8_21_14_0_10_36_19]|nr:MAG: hypothetical protein COU74_01580 [Candidatus Peregrinibacteria bacterium CG10_big_fil_rev_8_21_14_0_10_36_19]